jgi:hypothetical protein
MVRSPLHSYSHSNMVGGWGLSQAATLANVVLVMMVYVPALSLDLRRIELSDLSADMTSSQRRTASLLAEPFLPPEHLAATAGASAPYAWLSTYGLLKERRGAACNNLLVILAVVVRGSLERTHAYPPSPFAFGGHRACCKHACLSRWGVLQACVSFSLGRVRALLARTHVVVRAVTRRACGICELACPTVQLAAVWFDLLNKATHNELVRGVTDVVVGGGAAVAGCCWCCSCILTDNRPRSFWRCSEPPPLRTLSHHHESSWR